jgi:hypothetical protein
LQSGRLAVAAGCTRMLQDCLLIKRIFVGCQNLKPPRPPPPATTTASHYGGSTTRGQMPC